MLTPKSCDLFNIPFFQFSQLKKYQPENIPQIKADYKENWQVWQQLIQQVAAELGAPFAPPHIERWCNGWQVRAHFFAYFKYEQYKNSAAILSIGTAIKPMFHLLRCLITTAGWIILILKNTLHSICGTVRKANMTIIVPSPSKATAIESFETTKISSVSGSTSNVMI